ncbi:lycopene cyclase domain protein [Beutenbergia cavernae DSM 12333]|uniref:Lycopene cyclase domain protein n=1 Tax=Beutenbergia cavernae (strain ATCC BAA-8 / DSM 12333 / CCUG 43141 / JCM 11478 / NBRC 16432 / NCIMB 13614 / HKI 0122) TaxID=471853 RepID=C5C2A6_BEUC1|nr:lycopene cyclase domain-containing protein [Beutenbergia cavernae]ACQ81731.1 lycopene cyclase domain protein [Beutenbergia cavernae DSM 12333]
MRYLLLNAAVLAVVVLAAALLLRRARPTRAERRELGRPLALTALVLVAMTAVFDSLLIATGVIAYDEAALLGVRVGLAPLEDFAYTFAVLALAPALWIALGRRARGARRAGLVRGRPVDDDGATPEGGAGR